MFFQGEIQGKLWVVVGTVGPREKRVKKRVQIRCRSRGRCNGSGRRGQGTRPQQLSYRSHPTRDGTRRWAV